MSRRDEVKGRDLCVGYLQNTRMWPSLFCEKECPLPVGLLAALDP